MRPVAASCSHLCRPQRPQGGVATDHRLMTLSMAMIAFAPPYAAIGIAAPLLILLARLLQGFATGGEFASATTFLVESAPAHRRGFYGSLQMVGRASRRSPVPIAAR